MTRSDLRTGVVVTFRNGLKANVYKEFYNGNGNKDAALTDGNTCICLDGYTKDLTCSWNNAYDIVEIEYPLSVISLCKNPNGSNLATGSIWKRETPKRMTLAEIEAELGYKVEIVEEK